MFLPFWPMPLPLFANSLTAYSLMSPYGSIVGTVATTTMSPVAVWSVRIIRSIALALSASTTLAKSLTGCVSSGSAREAAD